MLHCMRCGSPLVSLLIFCSRFFSLEAPTRRVAGAPPSHSGPTAGRSPRLSLRPLNISTSQVGAGAHPVTAHPFCATFFLSFYLFISFFPSFFWISLFLNYWIFKFLSSSFFVCLPLSILCHYTLLQISFCFISSIINSFTGKRTNLTLAPLDWFWLLEQKGCTEALYWQTITLLFVLEYFQTRGATSTENHPSTNSTVLFLS